jgi:hypothetical protein
MSSDDAYETPVELVKVGTTTLSSQDKVAAFVGLRFQNVTIPPGSTITSATLILDLVTSSDSKNLAFIQGELPPNCDSLTFGGEGNISMRNKTADFVTATVPTTTGFWSITNSDAGSGGPDLSGIIQEIIDYTFTQNGVESSWASGNALSLIITSNSSSQRATFQAWDAAMGMNSATLRINWV